VSSMEFSPDGEILAVRQGLGRYRQAVAGLAKEVAPVAKKGTRTSKLGAIPFFATGSSLTPTAHPRYPLE
jgi:hypothetical protein